MPTTNTDNTKYVPSPPPTLDPNNPVYLQRELKKIEVALNAVSNALKSLSDRITALGG